MRQKYTLLFLPVILFFATGFTGLSETGDLIKNEVRKMVFFTGPSGELLLDPSGENAMFKKDTNVLLKVDTENISEGNFDRTVVISDDRSEASEVSGKPSEHVALVDKNMKIYWSAEPMDPETGVTVDVLGIFRKDEGGAEILERVFRDPNRDGIVMGKIKNKKVQGLEYYNILIRVNGETPQTFMIDPKLKMIID